MDEKNQVNIVKLLSSLIVLIMLVICGVTTFLSLIGSTYYDPYMLNETPSYKNDNLLLSLFLFVLLFSVAFFVYTLKRVMRISRKTNIFIVCSIAFAISMFAICIFDCGVSGDAIAVNNLAVSLLGGDYKTYLEQEYFIVCPHQVHMAFYFLLIYKIFGVNNYLAIQVINAICISSIVYIIQEMTFLITKDEIISKMSGWLSLLLIPLYLYATYIYGDVPGYTMAIIGTYLCMLFVNSGKWRYVLVSGMLFSLASIIKENVIIFLIAIIIIFFLVTIDKRNLKYIFAACLIGILSQVGIFCIDAYCTNKAGIESMPKGAPKEAWIVMGMEDGICGAGGFNGEIWEVMRENDYQSDLAKADCQIKIENNINAFIHNPKSAVKFYYRKYILQWNDPSFSSLINIEWSNRHNNNTYLSDCLLYNNGRERVSEVLNLCHLIVFLFATVGISKTFKTWSLEGTLVLIIILGGILFHELLWEAKGRYALFYYVLLIPFSSMGLEMCFRKMESYICMAKNRIL